MKPKTALIVKRLMDGDFPSSLSREEVELLVEEFGEGWFEEFGYDDEAYSRPA